MLVPCSCDVLPSLPLFLWVFSPHSAPFLPTLPRALPLSYPSPVPWWWGGGGAPGRADGQCLGVGGLEPLAEGFGGVEGLEAMNRVPEDPFPCLLRHGSLRSGLVGVLGAAGDDFLECVEAPAPLSPARFPCPPRPAGELSQRGGGPQGKVCGEVGGGLRTWGPAATVAGAGGGGRVSVAWGAGSAGPGLPFVGGGRCGHWAAVACVLASWEAGVAGAGPWGVTVVLRGAAVMTVGLRGRGCVVALWGAGAAGAGASFGGGRGALPVVGASSFAGQATQLWRHLQCKGGLVPCCRIRGGRGKISRPLWIRCVGRSRRVGWVQWCGWQFGGVLWRLRGLSRVGVAFGGLGFSVVGVVAGRLRFLVGGGQSLSVGWAVRLGARWPSQVVVLSVHEALQPGGLG